MAKAMRTRFAVACLAFLCAIAAAPLALTALSQRGIELPGTGSAQRLMAMLDARSPGEREKGELTKTKVAKQISQRPRQRALGKVFPPKPNPMEQLAKVITPPPAADTVETVAPIVPLSVGEIIAPASATAISSLVPPNTSVGGGVIGGGGSPGGGTGNVPPSPPVTSAVPEPGTWLMMLIGFAMIGSAVSRRGSRQPRAAAA